MIPIQRARQTVFAMILKEVRIVYLNAEFMSRFVAESVRRQLTDPHPRREPADDRWQVIKIDAQQLYKSRR